MGDSLITGFLAFSARNNAMIVASIPDIRDFAACCLAINRSIMWIGGSTDQGVSNLIFREPFAMKVHHIEVDRELIAHSGIVNQPATDRSMSDIAIASVI